MCCYTEAQFHLWCDQTSQLSILDLTHQSRLSASQMHPFMQSLSSHWVSKSFHSSLCIAPSRLSQLSASLPILMHLSQTTPVESAKTIFLSLASYHANSSYPSPPILSGRSCPGLLRSGSHFSSCPPHQTSVAWTFFDHLVYHAATARLHP